jgi:hypothetical protein
VRFYPQPSEPELDQARLRRQIAETRRDPVRRARALRVPEVPLEQHPAEIVRVRKRRIHAERAFRPRKRFTVSPEQFQDVGRVEVRLVGRRIDHGAPLERGKGLIHPSLVQPEIPQRDVPENRLLVLHPPSGEITGREARVPA